MDRCHVSQKLSSYLDNQLTGKEKQRIEEHLKGCAVCTGELSRLKALSEKLKTWQIADLGAGFDAQVKNEIVRQELEGGAVKMEKKTLAFLVPSGIVAGILVFLFAGVMLTQMYVHRGLQGRVTESADNIDGQYELKYSATQLAKRGGLLGTDAVQGIPLGSYRIDKDKGEYAKANVDYNYQLGGNAGEGQVIVIQPTLPATGQGEKIIRTALVKVEVEDGQEAYQKAADISKEFGGYIAASNLDKDRTGRQVGSITMRIPQEKFQAALDKLATLGKVEDVATNSQDVSQEYANLKAQLDAANIVYTKMLEALQKRQTNISEAVRLESELSPILRRIEGLKNKIEYLNNAVSFTTITVRFYEAEVSAKVLRDSREQIKTGMLKTQINMTRAIPGVVSGAITFVLTVIWFLVIAAVILGIVFLLKYWILRIFRRG